MEDTPGGSALIEISLALAMAFFTLLVLALVAISVPTSTAPNASVSVAALTLLPSSNSANSRPLKSDELLLIYHQGQLLSSDLTPFDIESINPATKVVVAISPTEVLATAVKVVSQLPTTATLTPLTANWQQRLQELP
jgi:hypothetical protein